MSGTPPLLAFFGHHKCASQWLGALIRDVCALTGLRPVGISRIEDSPDVANLAQFVARTRPDFLVYANADARQVRDLGPLRGFHVFRDPRDLLVSAYFSHRNSHPLATWPGLDEHRRRLQGMSAAEGLLLEMDFSRRVLEEVGSWPSGRPDVLEVRMEDLVGSPYESVARIMASLGLVRPERSRTDAVERLAGVAASTASGAQRAGGDLLYGLLRAAHRVVPGIYRDERGRSQPFPPRDHLGAIAPLARLRFRRRRLDLASLLSIVHRHRFSRLAGGRRPGDENAHSHYRKGVPGDWRNHFEAVHVERFKRSYNDVLLRLGYETDPDWHLPAKR